MTKERKILIVDDTIEYLQTAMNYIIEENSPYEILAATNGKSALKIATDEIPDLIIMDWEMPEMNGIETTKKLKQKAETMDIPVIISTGFRLTPLDLKQALEAGASDYIRKPIEKTEFIARINSHLKMSDYISEIKNQSRQIAETENAMFANIIDTLNTRIDETKSDLQFYDNFLTQLARQIELVSNNEVISKDDLTHITGNIAHLKRQFSTIDGTNKAPDNAFIQNLIRKHKNITPLEIQLSFMLKSGMSTKEIANLTFREEGSVKVSRSRLRKKLNLNDDDNLVVYLKQF